MTGDVRTEIIEELRILFEEDGMTFELIDDSSVLLETSLDSLGFAALVARLEDRLGYDPFTLMDEPVYPRTLGEFVDSYQRFAP